MNIWLENVNLNSTSGPNSFAQKLEKYVHIDQHHTINHSLSPDIILSFIESYQKDFSIPTVQRLDGIYFNTRENYELQNSNIRRTYENSAGVIFQSEFNKNLTFKYFGPHRNYTVIHNGADTDLIDTISPVTINKYENIWCCASSWRPHKRLSENIRYFLEHSKENECLVVAGANPNTDIKKNERIYYVGEVALTQLLTFCKSSKYFLHLAWNDHCPNVVVDARACGCKIVCSSTGGTKEIAGENAIIIEEEKWDYSPIDLYDPPKMDFSKKIKNTYNSEYAMYEVTKMYLKFLEETKK